MLRVAQPEVQTSRRPVTYKLVVTDVEVDEDDDEDEEEEEEEEEDCKQSCIW